MGNWFVENFLTPGTQADRNEAERQRLLLEKVKQEQQVELLTARSQSRLLGTNGQAAMSPSNTYAPDPMSVLSRQAFAGQAPPRLGTQTYGQQIAMGDPIAKANYENDRAGVVRDAFPEQYKNKFIANEFRKPPTPMVVPEKSRVVLPDQNDPTKFTEVLGATADAPTFKPTNMRVPGTDTFDRADTQEKYAELRGKGFLPTGETLPGAKTDNSAFLLTGDALDMAADQLIAGDPSPMQGLGYGNVGATNRAALRNKVAEKATKQGISGADLAAINAEYFGTKAGERALGTRSANIDMSVNEAKNMGPILRETSAAVPRGQWKTPNAWLNAYRTQTGDVATRQLGASLNSYLNAYATAVGKGMMTVDGRKHAEDMLSTADSAEVVAGVMDILDKEMQAALEAPGQSRAGLREAITGKKPGAEATKPAGNAKPSIADLVAKHRSKR